MLKEKMYVRVPADSEYPLAPRIFVCGQIMRINTFAQTAGIRIHDPFNYRQFYEELPFGDHEYPLESIDRCTLFIGSEILINGKRGRILSVQEDEDALYSYYVQILSTKMVVRAREDEIIATFNNGRIDPSTQLMNYELQKPCWYISRAIVSRSMNILENSIHGFKELAGSKIYLLPHQVNTIMRCAKEEKCRYMLADEVGMGKTVEAISILKIYLQNNCSKQILIITPPTLKEQWRTELLIKFSLSVGNDANGNCIVLKSITELSAIDLFNDWDYVIIDEVHKYLSSDDSYTSVKMVSKQAKNILLLSATPVRQRKDEYLRLMQILDPEKYEKFSIEEFSILIDKQNTICERTTLALSDLEDYEEAIEDAQRDEINPRDSEDCSDLFDDLKNRLKRICKDLNDEKLNQLFHKIDFEAEDFGIYAIKVLISYICSNYQIENHLIRNRRSILVKSDDEVQLLPTRELQLIHYSLDKDRNLYETLIYNALVEWITERAFDVVGKENVCTLLSSFFSSSVAFQSALQELDTYDIPDSILENAKKWVFYENRILESINEILDDPDTYEDMYSTRIVSVLNTLYEDLYGEKTVLFTDNIATYSMYRTALQKLYDEETISFFCTGMSSTEMEVNAYKFQNEAKCKIMLCDRSGGEGRNFQCADYIVHIDLPWNAGLIEQRIGRLDRLERDPGRSIVHSVVVYIEDTFEEELVKLWNEGLHIFTQSLSGMEIIMKDIDDAVLDAVQKDLEYGIYDRVPEIIKLAESMQKAVQKEQSYDAAAYLFKPLYQRLQRSIEFYALNENDLFASTMTNWAKMAGFSGARSKEELDIVRYSASSFSPRAAMNAQFIPPMWNEYMNKSQNRFATDAENAYRISTKRQGINGTIKGTFIRKHSIENDYLHFFAPGDEVFDCIVQNALQSCKGQASAFMAKSDIMWEGLIFTWTLALDEAKVYERGISPYSISNYRNYLMTEQIVVPIAINNPKSVKDDSVIAEYLKLTRRESIWAKMIHFGQRSKKPQPFRRELFPDISPLEYFKRKYPHERWAEIVSTFRKTSKKKAMEVVKRRSSIKEVREEMERVLSARMANCEFFGLNDEDIAVLQKEQECVLEVLKNPRLVLDSAAYVYFVEAEDE